MPLVVQSFLCKRVPSNRFVVARPRVWQPHQSSSIFVFDIQTELSFRLHKECASPSVGRTLSEHLRQVSQTASASHRICMLLRSRRPSFPREISVAWKAIGNSTWVNHPHLSSLREMCHRRPNGSFQKQWNSSAPCVGICAFERLSLEMLRRLSADALGIHLV